MPGASFFKYNIKVLKHMHEELKLKKSLKKSYIIVVSGQLSVSRIRSNQWIDKLKVSL